ncbi:MAG: SseB family protein [Deltaproteobacteria bacterium]|nr:SseB family protein [Deltaproteobacteria bacterium]
MQAISDFRNQQRELKLRWRMKAPNEPSNQAEQAIAEFYQCGVSKSDLVERLSSEIVHIPMDGSPIVDEQGNASEGTSLCLPKPSGQRYLVLVTSFPMFAPLVEEFPQYSQTFVNYTLETVLVHTSPEYGFVVNPKTAFEFEISPRDAAVLRERYA